MTLSDKRKDTYTVEDLKEGLYKGIDLKNSIKELKEEIILETEKKNKGRTMYFLNLDRFEVEEIINKVFGRRLTGDKSNG